MFKNLLLFPSALIPFLASAYSRACENTCDNIGYALCPGGLKNGLLVLASGKSIYKNVNTDEYLAQIQNERGFWKWFSEKSSSHPHLTKRINRFRDITPATKVEIEKPKPTEVKTEDHSRYFPKTDS